MIEKCFLSISGVDLDAHSLRQVARLEGDDVGAMRSVQNRQSIETQFWRTPYVRCVRSQRIFDSDQTFTPIDWCETWRIESDELTEILSGFISRIPQNLKPFAPNGYQTEFTVIVQSYDRRVRGIKLGADFIDLLASINGYFQIDGY